MLAYFLETGATSPNDDHFIEAIILFQSYLTLDLGIELNQGKLLRIVAFLDERHFGVEAEALSI